MSGGVSEIVQINRFRSVDVFEKRGNTVAIDPETKESFTRKGTLYVDARGNNGVGIMPVETLKKRREEASATMSIAIINRRDRKSAIT